MSLDAKHMRGVPYSNCGESLMYTMISTKLDLAYEVSLVNRFIGKLSRVDWQAASWLYKYLKGTMKLKLGYSQSDMRNSEVIGYCDSDYAGDLDKRR